MTTTTIEAYLPIGYDTVEIRDLNIEVLPHPDLKQWINPTKIPKHNKNVKWSTKHDLQNTSFLTTTKKSCIKV